MKKVTAFVGTGRKKSTYGAVRQFLDNLSGLGDVECEIVALSDHPLGMCRGCKLRFEKGEEFCPLKDDRDALIEKIAISDGVVFASPNYSFQVSAMMKGFLDRVASQSISVLFTLAFNRSLQIAMPLQEPRTAFLGFFFGGINAVAFVLQLGLCPWLLRRFQVRPILAAIPILYGAAALAGVFSPVLPVGTGSVREFPSPDRRPSANRRINAAKTERGMPREFFGATPLHPIAP